MAERQFTAGETIDLPISKLVMSKDNPRKTKEKGADPVLVASIRSRGLLQNLGVRPSATYDGKFEVRFGERRLRALRALAKEGHFGKEDAFPCKILSEDEAEADEAALCENISRLNMNPVDEFEAFKRLQSKGLEVRDIARRFGITERQVLQRLALGGAAPCVRKALREGEISLDIAKLFAGCADVSRQERVFKSIDERGCFSAWSVKQMLHDGVVTAKDDVARFVTLEAYEAAGGAVEKDLFSDEVRLRDVALLYRLRDEMLEREVERLIQEGWSWVEAHEGYSYDAVNAFTRIYGEPLEKSEDEKREIEKIEKELEALDQEGETGDDWSEEQWERYEGLEERLSDLRQTRRVFTDEQKAIAGCIIYPGRDGVEIHEGLVRKDDLKKATALAAGEGADEDRGDAASDESIKPAYGIGLKADLAAFKAQALQAALVGDPTMAVLAHQFILVYRLLGEAYQPFPAGSTVSASLADLRIANGDLGATAAAVALAKCEKGSALDAIAGADYRNAWKAFRNLEKDKRDALVSLAFSRTIEPMRGSDGFTEFIARELQFDVRRFWKPTAENFFSRIKKDQLAAFLKETLGADEAARLAKDFKLKKSELARLCEDLIDGGTPVSAEARARLDAWAPDGMAFEEPPAIDADDDDPGKDNASTTGKGEPQGMPGGDGNEEAAAA